MATLGQTPSGSNVGAAELQRPWAQTERGVRAEERLTENLYDLEAWGVLLREAQSGTIERARIFYERLVGVFPLSGRFWKAYVEHEMRCHQFEQVEKIFQRCLVKVIYLDLWKCYLMYVRETKASLSGFREKMAQAYDFALAKVGLDVASTSIWTDYIAFLKGGETSGSYAENHKITAIRRVYQRAVVTPINMIDVIWKEYNAFEQSINKVLAKKLCEERNRDYQTARRVAKEAEVVMRGLQKGMHAVPPQTSAEEEAQLRIWKRFIAWEKTNPMRASPAVLKRRVVFAYEQCLLVFGHHPDIWLEVTYFLESASKNLAAKGDATSREWLDEATALYDRAISSYMGKKLLVYVAYADFEESRMHLEKCHELYNKLINAITTDRTLAYIHYMRFARRAEGIRAARLVFKRAREDNKCDHQIYVAAALMEYACSKDKSIALKIFELGLKRCGQNVDYIKAYLEFAVSLNEDNNTRVLFERVLPGLSGENARDLWEVFRQFEALVGDLQSVIKVESRISTIFEKEVENNEGTLLVDRYRFLDLWPCSNSELISMKHSGFLRGQSTTSSVQTRPVARKQPTLVERSSDGPAVPDVSQMLPFRPSVKTGANVQGVSGGTFPAPPAVSDLVQLLPPPTCFQGPFVNVDLLCRSLGQAPCPDDFSAFAEQIGNQGAAKPSQPAQSSAADAVSPPNSNNGVSARSGNQVGNRKRPPDEHHDSDDEGSAPPVNDIYRARQLKRVHTAS